MEKLKTVLLPSVNLLIFVIYVVTIVECVISNYIAGNGWALVSMYLVAVLSAPLSFCLAAAGIVSAIRDRRRLFNLLSVFLTLTAWITLLILSCSL